MYNSVVGSTDEFNSQHMKKHKVGTESVSEACSDHHWPCHLTCLQTVLSSDPRVLQSSHSKSVCLRTDCILHDFKRQTTKKQTNLEFALNSRVQALPFWVPRTIFQNPWQDGQSSTGTDANERTSGPMLKTGTPQLGC